MVDVAQSVEQRVVVPWVAGSSPVIHPIFQIKVWSSGCGAVGSALALGARGRQFKSGHPDQFKDCAPVAQQDRATDF